MAVSEIDRQLLLASYQGNFNVVAHIIYNFAANVNVEGPVHGINGTYTPLTAAIKGGDDGVPVDKLRKTLEVLMIAGANLNIEKCIPNLGCGYTPLTMAIMNENVVVARELIMGGANLDVISGETDEELSIYDHAQIAAVLNPKMKEIVNLLEYKFGNHLQKLNVPLSGSVNIDKDDAKNAVSLEEIEEGQEVYLINDEKFPYSRNSMRGLIDTPNSKSPMTRNPILDIKRHTAKIIKPNVKQNTNPVGGKRNIRKRGTRKHKSRSVRNQKRTTRKYR
jgi:hypothetical protein